MILTVLASVFVVSGSYASEGKKGLPSMGEQTASLGEALEKANGYSFETGGIGIIISYGTKNGVTAEAIGNAFVGELKERGYGSRYYFYNTDRDGVALSFRIGYSSLGPWGPDEAAQNINQVTERAKAAHKIHGIE